MNPLQALKNTAQSAGQLQSAQAMQKKMQTMLQGITVTGKSKNGKVTVTMNGEQTILDMFIDPTLIVFVHDSFLKDKGFNNGLTSFTPEQEDASTRSNRFFKVSLIEAIADAIKQVQGEMVKKMTAAGGVDDLKSMLDMAASLPQQ